MKKKEEFPEPDYAQTIALHLCKCYEGIGEINQVSFDRAYTYDGNPVEDIDGKFSTFVIKGNPTILRKRIDNVEVRVMCYHKSDHGIVEITFSRGENSRELATKLRKFIEKGESKESMDFTRILPNNASCFVRSFA